jgi:hypothetical protein
VPVLDQFGARPVGALQPVEEVGDLQSGVDHQVGGGFVVFTGEFQTPGEYGGRRVAGQGTHVAGPGGGRGDPPELESLRRLGVAPVEPAGQQVGEPGLVAVPVVQQIGGQFARNVLAQTAELGGDDGQLPGSVVQLEPAAQRLHPVVGDLLDRDTREIGAGTGDPGLSHPGCLGLGPAGRLACRVHPRQGVRVLSPLGQPGTEIVGERGVLLAHSGDLLLGGGAPRGPWTAAGGSLPVPVRPTGLPAGRFRHAGAGRQPPARTSLGAGRARGRALARGGAARAGGPGVTRPMDHHGPRCYVSGARR